MRVLITGASGFIGRAMLAALAGVADLQIHAVSRSAASAVAGQSSIHWHRADLLDANDISRLFRDTSPTHLVHLAWATEHGNYWNDPSNERWADSGAAMLRQFAEYGGKRAVIAGSCAEYTWGVGEGICTEDHTPTVPSSAYGRAKYRLYLETERLGIPVAWARLFFLYGPRESPGRLVPTVIRSLLNGEIAQCTVGTQIRDYMHVSDAAGALSALMHADVTGAVNIGSGAGVSVRSLIELIAAELDRPGGVSFGDRPSKIDEPPILVADTRRLRTTTGFRAEVPLVTGVRRTIEWWRSAGTYAT